MQLIFVYGGVASGKFTIAKELAGRTGFKLFHNHLVVDAVAAVFPFGSDAFVRLRDQFWMATFEAAAATDQSLIFTFAPEPTVSSDFPERVKSVVEQHGGTIVYVALQIGAEEQERRLIDQSRAQFGKMRDQALFRELRVAFDASLKGMPEPDITIESDQLTPGESAAAIVDLLAKLRTRT